MWKFRLIALLCFCNLASAFLPGVSDLPGGFRRRRLRRAAIEAAEEIFKEARRKNGTFKADIYLGMDRHTRAYYDIYWLAYEFAYRIFQIDTYIKARFLVARRDAHSKKAVLYLKMSDPQNKIRVVSALSKYKNALPGQIVDTDSYKPDFDPTADAHVAILGYGPDAHPKFEETTFIYVPELIKITDRQKYRDAIKSNKYELLSKPSGLDVVDCVTEKCPPKIVKEKPVYPPDNCELNSWDSWGPCEKKKCIRSRIRTIKQKPEKGGIPCSVYDLREEEDCLEVCPEPTTTTTTTTSTTTTTTEKPGAKRDCKNNGHLLCNFWASKGECERNKKVMETVCENACFDNCR